MRQILELLFLKANFTLHYVALRCITLNGCIRLVIMELPRLSEDVEIPSPVQKQNIDRDDKKIGGDAEANICYNLSKEQKNSKEVCSCERTCGSYSEQLHSRIFRCKYFRAECQDQDGRDTRQLVIEINNKYLWANKSGLIGEAS